MSEKYINKGIWQATGSFMLRHLYIRDYALADELELDFGPGLNVITGETGAGKSILVGALGLALGGRADRSQIRSGADACSVTAVFELAGDALVMPVLEEAALPLSDENTLVLRRIVTASGAGKAFVNDAPVTLRFLQRIGEALVDMHGPHEQQSLFQPSFQLTLLDDYGRLAKQRAAYDHAYSHSVKLENLHRELADGEPLALAREADMLRFQIREIEEASVSATEEFAIRAEHKLQGQAQRIAELAHSANTALAEGDCSAFAALAAAQQSLAELESLVPEAAAWRQETRALAVRIQELESALQGLLLRLDVDPGRLNWLDERMALYSRLCRKYGPDINDVIMFCERARERMDVIESRAERLKELESEKASARAALLAAATPLTKGRHIASERLGAAVAKELRSLGFAAAKLQVDVQPSDPAPSGADKVEFYFAPNPGEPARALRETASSGEISRVMLALKCVFAEHDKVPVLIFDEIDVNLGGKTAHVVGQKLATLGHHRQVLAITHLPQVAVHGTRHMSVAKETVNGRTVTRVVLLEGTSKVEEIARMLGGRDLTSVTMRHAREMLKAGADPAQ